MTLFSQELWVLVIFYYIKQLDFYSSLIFNNLFFFLQHLSLWYSKTGEVTCIQYQKLQNCFYWCTINYKLHFDKYLKYIYTPWNLEFVTYSEFFWFSIYLDERADCKHNKLIKLILIILCLDVDLFRFYIRLWNSQNNDFMFYRGRKETLP